jgi:hypothetical protein
MFSVMVNCLLPWCSGDRNRDVVVESRWLALL